jgi:hypothetical protein
MIEVMAEGGIGVNIEELVDRDGLHEFEGCLLVVQHREG